MRKIFRGLISDIICDDYQLGKSKGQSALLGAQNPTLPVHVLIERVIQLRSNRLYVNVVLCIICTYIQSTYSYYFIIYSWIPYFRLKCIVTVLCYVVIMV
jgi:hypothetical protein